MWTTNGETPGQWDEKNTLCICPEGGIKLKKETYDVTGMSCAACSSRVEKAEIFTKDQYAVLLICDDSGAVKTAFEDFLSSNN